MGGTEATLIGVEGFPLFVEHIEEPNDDCCKVVSKVDE